MSDEENPLVEPNLQLTYATVLPNCDVCGSSGLTVAASYDAKTKYGPWANLCTSHFVKLGTGLGLGKGRRLFQGERPATNGKG